jgi:hypothetical protein
VTNVCGVPLTARALVLNLAVTQATAIGNLVVYTTGSPRPTTSAVNYTATRSRADNTIVAPDASGNITIYSNQLTGSVHVIVDVDGYFQ